MQLVQKICILLVVCCLSGQSAQGGLLSSLQNAMQIKQSNSMGGYLENSARMALAGAASQTMSRTFGMPMGGAGGYPGYYMQPQPYFWGRGDTYMGSAAPLPYMNYPPVGMQPNYGPQRGGYSRPSGGYAPSQPTAYDDDRDDGSDDDYDNGDDDEEE